MSENEIDLSVLPVLPDGYYWKVGKKDTNPGWYDNKPTWEDALLIVRRGRVEATTKEVDVYGTQWWNKNSVVGKETKTFKELTEDKTLFSHAYRHIEVTSAHDLPDFGRITGRMTNAQGVEHGWWYDLPVDQAGTEFLAKILYSRFALFEGAMNDNQPHNLMRELHKLVKDLESEGDLSPYPNMPPYGKGRADGSREAARRLAMVLRLR